jgi:hypothetical protein
MQAPQRARTSCWQAGNLLTGALLLLGCGGHSIEVDPGLGSSAGRGNGEAGGQAGAIGVTAPSGVVVSGGASSTTPPTPTGAVGPGDCDIPQWDTQVTITVPLRATSDTTPSGTFTACRQGECYPGIVSDGPPLVITGYARETISVAIASRFLILSWSGQFLPSGSSETFTLAYYPPDANASVPVIDTLVAYPPGSTPTNADCTIRAHASLILNDPVDLSATGEGGAGGEGIPTGGAGGDSSVQAGGAAGAD